MRVGNNPNRTSRAEKLERVILFAVTYLPNLYGYHADRLEVVKTCLTSMTEHVGVPYSLVIWDNGSCNELLSWVKDSLKPSILIESANLGKNTARTSVIQMLPKEKIICYSDDDIYFYPNWLKPQIDLLKHFPAVACVTGYPVRTSFRWGNHHTMEWAKKFAHVEAGKFIPQSWEDDFAVSIGRDINEHRKMTKNDLDQMITYKGVKAYATSHHCQFIGRADNLSRITVYDDFAMGDERSFDMALDSIGLRLATVDRYTRHIGNVLDEKLKQEIGV